LVTKDDHALRGYHEQRAQMKNGAGGKTAAAAAYKDGENFNR